MAQQLDCILLSLHRDFVDIVAFPPGRYKGIIALQVKNRPGAIPDILERLRQYLSSHPDMLFCLSWNWTIKGLPLGNSQHTKEPDDLQAQLPLRRIWVLVPSEEIAHEPHAL